MLCSDLSSAKVSKITGLACRNICRRIDFYHERVRSFVACREDVSRIDFSQAGSRFATDSQALIVNCPSRKRRFPVIFQHLRTAHARSGFIVEASFQLDPDISPAEAQARSLAANENKVSTAFRRHARVWTKTAFDAHLARLAKAAGVLAVEEHGLPATGSTLRYDVARFAHAMRLRDRIGETDAPLIFVMDGDAGLKRSFTAVFQPEVAAGRAHLLRQGDDERFADLRRGRRPDRSVRLDGPRSLVISAMAVFRAASRNDAREGSWLARMLERKPRRLAAVALANKMARGLRGMMTTKEDHRDPTPASAGSSRSRCVASACWGCEESEELQGRMIGTIRGKSGRVMPRADSPAK